MTLLAKQRELPAAETTGHRAQHRFGSREAAGSSKTTFMSMLKT